MNALAVVGQVPLVVGVEERVAAVREERHVRVHARPVLAEDRLRHEGRVDAVLRGDLLDDQPVGDRVVGHLERRREAACRSRAATARPRGGGTRSRMPIDSSASIVSSRSSVAASCVVIAK